MSREIVELLSLEVFKTWMWHFKLWLRSDYGGAGLMVGVDDL